MKSRYKKIRKIFNLAFLFLYFIKPFSASAQYSMKDSLVLDSLHDVITEDIINNKGYDKGREAVKIGLKKVIKGTYNFYKFSYYDALIKNSEKQVEDAIVLFKLVIKEGTSSPDYRFRHLAGLSHTEMAKIHAASHDEKNMDAECEKALKLFESTDFVEKQYIYTLQYNYYLSQEINIATLYILKRLNVSLKEYIYYSLQFYKKKQKNEIHKRVASVCEDLGYYYEYKNDFINAKVFYQLSFFYNQDLFNTNLRSKIIGQYNLAYVEFYLKDYSTSELLAKDIISSNASLDNPDLELESGCLKLLGDIRIEKKDYIDALKYYEKAMEIADSIYDDGNSDIQYFHEGLAAIHYRLENYPKAIKEYKKALKTTINDNGKNKLNYLIGLGECYSFSDKKQASKYFKEALEIVEHVSEIQKNEAIARINYKMGLLESNKVKAYPYHELSRKAINNSQYPIEDASENLIRMAQFNLEDETTFLQLMKEAIISNLARRKEYDTNNIPDIKDISFPMSLLKCYHRLGNYFKEKDKEKALDYYLMAKDLITIIKPIYRYENSKSALIQESIPIYEKIIAISSDKYLNSNDSKYFEQAFDAVEKSKSIQLNDAINDYKAIGSAGIPDSLFEYGQSIKTKIAYHQERLNTYDENLSEEQIKDINNTIVELNTKYYDYLVGIENDFPEYYKLKYNITPVDIQKIQKSITEKDLVLNYHLQDSFLIIFGISKNGLLIEKEQIRKEKIKEDIETFMQSLYNKEQEKLKQQSQKLYDILLRKVLEKTNNIEHLIITPDGVLNYLSFELLAENNKNNSQLIYSKSIVYNYSSTQVYQKKKTIRKRHQFLGIAPLYNSDEFDKLPHAKKEIEKIYKKWGGYKLENENASLENFKNEAKKYSIIHIAGHAEVNNDFPLQSRLVFSESDYASHSLYAHELYNMKLDLDMVSLSACNSGIGSLKQGEGAMSLARGFAYAGCPSTIMTLWPMTDKPTMDIMVQYYDYLKDGLPKSQALRNAKLDYLKICGPKAQDPYFWAGIVIIGSDSPLSHGHFYQQLWFQILLGIILLLLLIITIKRFKS